MRINQIEQHIYTRAAKTMFSQTEGYGTVAKTDGLSEAFVKEKIHPYCEYPTAPALKNYAVHPKAITVVNYPCGRMLLGQATYVPVDFTGQRSAFFAHNYVLPSDIAAKYIQDGVPQVEFLTEWEGDAPPREFAFRLDSLIAAEKTSAPMIDNRSRLISLGAASPAWLDHIARCATASVYSAKKTYVMLPLDICVWSLLPEIYSRLDDAVKQILGFTTYAREPRNKEGLHLIFLEDGVIAPTDPRLKSDFVIDFKTVPSPAGSIISLSPKKFFSYMEFLHIRLPQAGEYLFSLETEWLDANLDKLSLLQLSVVPDNFIKRGKKNNHCELHVITGILKACSYLKGEFDLRYILGGYILAEKYKLRAEKNLKRLFREQVG